MTKGIVKHTITIEHKNPNDVPDNRFDDIMAAVGIQPKNSARFMAVILELLYALENDDKHCLTVYTTFEIQD